MKCHGYYLMLSFLALILSLSSLNADINPSYIPLLVRGEPMYVPQMHFMPQVIHGVNDQEIVVPTVAVEKHEYEVTGDLFDQPLFDSPTVKVQKIKEYSPQH